MHKRNLGREKRVLADKPLGAINGVDQPEVVSVLLRSAGFFTVKTVLWKLLQYHVANRLLAFDISLRYRRQICLGRNRKVAVEIGTTDVGSCTCSIQRSAQKL